MSTRLGLLVVLLLSAAPGWPAKLPPPSMFSLVQSQCAGSCSCVLDADCGTAGTCTGGICTAGSIERVSCRVSDTCAVGQACTPPPHACSPNFSVAGGVAVLKGLPQPKPTCPRTGMPEENNVGQMKLTGVMKDGAPFTGTLRGEVSFTVTFRPDPDPTCPGGSTPEECCPLSGIHFPGVAGLSGDLECRNGKCKGRMIASDCLPAGCRDTVVVAEIFSVAVRDEAGALLATPGVFLGSER